MTAHMPTPRPGKVEASKSADTGGLRRHHTTTRRRAAPYARDAIAARAWGAQSDVVLVAYGNRAWDRAARQRAADEQAGHPGSCTVWDGRNPASRDWAPFAARCVLLVGDPPASDARLAPLARELLTAGAGEVLAEVAGRDAARWRAGRG